MNDPATERPPVRERLAFPVVLDLTDRRVVVVGGGAVGRRKAAAARLAGAAVRIIDPNLSELSPDLGIWIREPYRPAHLDGAWLVFCAAPASVNAAAIADANARGIWACDVGDPIRGGFAMPAVGRRGALTVAVSTGGAAPGFAARVRDELVAGLDPCYAEWVELLAELRPRVLASLDDPAARRIAFAKICEPAWLPRLKSEGIDAVRRAMLTEMGLATE